jgi:FMN phosphatase YigB (HAD superfamily)
LRQGTAQLSTGERPRGGTRTLLALDLDGVILDPQRGGRGPWQLAFSERFGVDARRLDETLFATVWAEVITGKCPIETALNEALQELGWVMSVDAALQCWFEEDFVTEPDVMAAATAWSQLGFPLALVSNQEPRRARFLEGRLAPLLPIGGVAFSGDLGVVKSDPDFYGQAEHRLGVVGLGRSVVFLDDTPSNVETATRHGWAAIHFTKDNDWQREVAAALERSRMAPHLPEPA